MNPESKVIWLIDGLVFNAAFNRFLSYITAFSGYVSRTTGPFIQTPASQSVSRNANPANLSAKEGNYYYHF